MEYLVSSTIKRSCMLGWRNSKNRLFEVGFFSREGKGDIKNREKVNYELSMDLVF